MDFLTQVINNRPVISREFCGTAEVAVVRVDFSPDQKFETIVLRDGGLYQTWAKTAARARSIGVKYAKTGKGAC